MVCIRSLGIAFLENAMAQAWSTNVRNTKEKKAT